MATQDFLAGTPKTQGHLPWHEKSENKSFQDRGNKCAGMGGWNWQMWRSTLGMDYIHDDKGIGK